MNKYDINQLSLQEKIGQLFMFGFDATVPNDHAIKLIRDYKVGNVILFARNIKTPEQLFYLNQNLQKLAIEHIGIPLFISIDQEGGMVTRILEGGTFFPGAMTIAASNNVEHAYLVGKHMGKELKAFGINMNFAPVLDVNNNPKNPVIGVRSFSDDPKMVSDYGVAFVKGLQESIIATGKHFPGHGDTHVDSHLALPQVLYGMERLNQIELVPFKKAINQGIKAIMSSHIDFPALTENGLPTTLSKKCLTGYLREELGFEGLIVTDGMQMKAIQDNYTTVGGSLMALEAGANIVCICHSEELQIKATQRVYEAVIHNELSLDLINERVNRVLKYKSELDSLDLNLEYEQIKEIVLDKTTKAFAYQIVEDAATLVKGHPLRLKANALFVGILPKATTIADETDGEHHLIKDIRRELPGLETLVISVDPNDREIELVLEKSKNYQQVILTTFNANIYQSQIKLVNLLSDQKSELHVISMRNPYDLYYTKQIMNNVCLYEYTPNSIQVLMNYLKGDVSLLGKLPVHYE